MQNILTVRNYVVIWSNLTTITTPFPQVHRVNLLADSVKAQYPREKAAVEVRQDEIRQHWDTLKAKATERRNRLEEAVGQQIFLNSAKVKRIC